MSTSETNERTAPATASEAPALVSTAVVVGEAIVAAVLATGLAVFLAPDSLGAAVRPHPAWAVVLLLAARYGSRGFVCALVSQAGALALAAALLGKGLAPLTAAAQSGADLAALSMSVLVAWLASAHERRWLNLALRHADLVKRCIEDAAIMLELRHAAVELRARADRLDNSLTFIRDVASRLEGTNPVASAQAALELAIARTGARAGVVQWLERRRLRTVASQGLWTLEQAAPPDVVPDRTIQAACDKAAPVSLADVESPGRHDSDVAAPILDRSGKVLGVLALRGLPADSLRHALVHDVGLIARWCAQASRAAQRSRSDAGDSAERDRVSVSRGATSSRSRTLN